MSSPSLTFPAADPLDDLSSGSLAPEIANTLTHGLGLVLSVAAAFLLLERAQQSDALQFWACAAYAATMVSVYFASTCSHLVWNARARHFFRMLDQGCIYLFIAGSFTPVAAAFLRGGSWWILLSAMWLIAGLGFVSKVILVHRVYSASVAIPLMLGWLPLTGGPSMLALVPAAVVWWMLAGGLCYTIGTLFLMFDTRYPLLHAVWHLLVIAGTTCQFVAIYSHTLPSG